MIKLLYYYSSLFFNRQLNTEIQRQERHMQIFHEDIKSRVKKLTKKLTKQTEPSRGKVMEVLVNAKKRVQNATKALAQPVD
jgi:uncharacterized protein with PhoU and TrkA domain